MFLSPINKLQQFMLTTEMMNKTKNHKLENDKFNNGEAKKISFSCTVPIRVNNPLAIMPTQPDTLFWCFFIIKHGVSTYYMRGQYTFAFEKQLKFQYIEQFRKQKELLKTFKTSLNEVENQLANDISIQLNTFFCLCALENINVIYFNNNTYFDFISQPGVEIHVLEKTPSSSKTTKKNNPFYQYVGTINNEEFNVRSSRCFKLDTLDKALKCITAYKVKEVEDFCTQLQINIFTDKNNVDCTKKKKKNKTELFHYLQKYLEIIK